jgi:hypothetical protein
MNKYNNPSFANCWALTRCIQINYVLDHEWASSLLFLCVVCILWVSIFYVGMRSVVYHIKGKFYDWIFVRVIRERWLQAPVFTYHSITCRTGKEYGRKHRTVRSLKLVKRMPIFTSEFSTIVTLVYCFFIIQWTANGFYPVAVVLQ